MGTTDVLRGAMTVSNYRDRISQYKLKLEAPEYQEALGTTCTRWKKRGTRAELVGDVLRKFPQRRSDRPDGVAVLAEGCDCQRNAPKYILTVNPSACVRRE